MKTFFTHIRVPLLEWYLVAACCYFGMWAMDLGLLVLAIVIGFVYTYIYDPIAYVLEPDVSYKGVPKVERDISSEKPQVWKQVGKAMLVCTMISGIYYYVNVNFFPTSVDPFTFGALYWVITHSIGKVIKKWN